MSLIEDGYVYAARAVSDERRSYIASVVATGLTDEKIEVNSSKYLLSLLSELTDVEIICLRFFLKPETSGGDDFRNKHNNVLEHVIAYMDPPRVEHDNLALQNSYKDHLERLGLIDGHIRKNRGTGMPEFDPSTGKPKVSYRKTTHLGRMLLSQIGLSDE